jgi:IS30 family transposase
MSYSHLNVHERSGIFYLKQMGLSFRQIGFRLGRHHTTISREFRRNARPFSGYWYGNAQTLAGRRKKGKGSDTNGTYLSQ